MTALVTTLVAVLAAWALAFAGAPLLVWTAAIGVLLLALKGLGLIGTTAFAIAGTVFVALALLLNRGGASPSPRSGPRSPRTGRDSRRCRRRYRTDRSSKWA